MGSVGYKVPSGEFADPIISERAVDEPRPLKVIYLGAGASGINAAIQLPKYVPNLELVIYDKNDDAGGTWWENRYPGCACDVSLDRLFSVVASLALLVLGRSILCRSVPDPIPAHSYQLSYESSTEWTKFYASASEILQYWQRVIEKYDLRKFMKFKHNAVEARWDEATSKWHVRFEKTDTGEIVEDVADVFIAGIGTLNQWKWPDIPGLETFKGPRLHSANWDSSFDFKDKTVAVIGAGSSGIQIVPALLPHVKSMDHYVRGRTWIAASFGHELVRERNDGKDGNFTYTEEEKEVWRKDPEAYIKYRKALECGMQGGYAVTHRGSKEHAGAWVAFEEDMKQRLTKKPEVAEHLIPSFPPLCKRLTPGPGYLEALTDEKCNVVADKIERIDETGVWTADGKHRPVDAIVCATGFDTSFQNRFPILGLGGKSLRERNRVRQETYLSVAVDGFPNFFQSLGPNAGVGNGNLIIIIEAIALYVGQVLQKLAQGNTLTVMPKSQAVQNFTNYCDAYFKRTVFSAECNSWYKSSPPGTSPEERKKGRISALWPGSSVHAVKTLEKVRWEDYDMTTVDGNDFGWFGDGWTVAERAGDREGICWYINGTNFIERGLAEEVDESQQHKAPSLNGLEIKHNGAIIQNQKEVGRVPDGIAAT